MTDLLELAALIEALEPGWEGLHPLNDEIHSLMPEPKVVQPLDYLRSLDAAMTLVPEGWTVGAIAQPDPVKRETLAYALLAENYIERGEDPWDEFRTTEEGGAATPALALCAAALKARAQS